MGGSEARPPGDGLFAIDAPGVDVAALEKRVREAIDRKRGVRFTDDELAVLRSQPLEPRKRREDLPHGLLERMLEVRSRLPEVEPSPSPVPASAVPRAAPPPPPKSEGGDGPWRAVAPAAELYQSGAQGIQGALVRALRRLFRPLYRLTLNLDHVLTSMVLAGEVQGQRLREYVDQASDGANDRIERSFDDLKDNLDQRVDRTVDWAGEHLSDMTGRLEKRHERSLHLSHNLVYEITHVRLDLEQTQDRLNDLTRRLDMVAARERALEEIALGDDEEEDQV